MKALVGTFNQEKALAETFSVIMKFSRTFVSSSTREAGPDSIWSRTQVIKMAEHLGFGHVVYYGLRHCRTEYVMIVQHDHPFSVKFRWVENFDLSIYFNILPVKV